MGSNCGPSFRWLRRRGKRRTRRNGNRRHLRRQVRSGLSTIEHVRALYRTGSHAMHARLHRLDRRSHSRLRHLHRAAHQLGFRLNVLRAFHSKNHRLGMRGVVLPDEPGVADDRNRDRPAGRRTGASFWPSMCLPSTRPPSIPPSISRGLRPLPGENNDLGTRDPTTSARLTLRARRSTVRVLAGVGVA